MYTTTDRCRGPLAPGTPWTLWSWSESAAAGTEVDAKAACHRCVHDSDDEPWSPKSITFHSNWPSWERKLVFNQSASRSPPGGIAELDRIW